MGTLETAVITIRMAAQPPTYGASAPLEQQAGVPPPYQGYAPAPQQGFPLQQGQGYAPPPQQGYAQPPQQGFGPPPQQGFPPPQTVQVTVQGNAAQTGLLRFNQNPMTMTCPFCQAHITTATSSRSGGAVWLTCLGITFFTSGICLPCAFIPFCIEDMKDQVHSCPNCGKVVGTYSKL